MGARSLIIKANMEALGAGESMGLNHHSRWNTEKRAAGSTLPAGEAVTVTGNAANSQAAARKTAQAVRFLRKPQLYICSVIFCLADCETAGQRVCAS